MATMTITITAQAAVNPISIISQLSGDCVSQRLISITVPSGQTRTIRISSSNDNFTSPNDGLFVISSSTVYDLLIEGALSGSGFGAGLPNNTSSFIKLEVLNGNNVESSTTLSRNHTGRVC